MVHNGIEYGDMQLICEAYNLMKDTLGMSHDGKLHKLGIKPLMHLVKIIIVYSLSSSDLQTPQRLQNFKVIFQFWKISEEY